MPEAAYDAPVFHEGIWYPTRNTRVSGRLVSITGVAYEFAPTKPIPHLLLMVTVPSVDGPISGGGACIEVHCFPERLLRQIEAVRPREGEDVEITTGPELVDGFLVYTVSAGGRWSVAEQWGPQEIQLSCAFGAHHLRAGAAEETSMFRPVTSPELPITGQLDVTPAADMIGSALFTDHPRGPRP